MTKSRWSSPQAPECSTASHIDTSVAAVLGLQFVAIAWIVLNQFRDHLGLDAAARSGLVAKGYIGAGLFFVASGYLLTAKYVELRAAGHFRYGEFLWRRLLFTYPLHLVVLVGMVCAKLVGEPTHQASFGFGDLPANLLLAQAWGAVRTDSWNFPSWLISADWFSYLAFPVTAWVGLRALRPAALGPAVALALFVTMFLLASRLGVLFTDMTTSIGALQTVPAVLLGATLWRLGKALRVAPVAGGLTAALAAVWVIAAASLRVSDLFIWPAFGPLVLGLASAGPFGWVGRASGLLAYLGRLSIATQLIYLPVDIAYFRVVKIVAGPLQGPLAWAVLAGVFPVIAVAAVAAHHGIQRPIARWAGAGPWRSPPANATRA